MNNQNPPPKKKNIREKAPWLPALPVGKCQLDLFFIDSRDGLRLTAAAVSPEIKTKQSIHIGLFQVQRYQKTESHRNLAIGTSPQDCCRKRKKKIHYCTLEKLILPMI